MLFHELVLTIMKSIEGQRTVSSPYHLIKGKKSGQTLQDVGYFDLHPYFALFPKLPKGVYDEQIRRLEVEGFLEAGGEAITLTPRGRGVKAAHTHLNGWKYRGKEALFFKRMSLAVQTFSHLSQGIRRFDPVQPEDDVQFWTKQFLHRISFRNPESYNTFSHQLRTSLEAVELPDMPKSVLVSRLSGHGTSGMTWQQIAGFSRMEPIDAQLAGVEMLHGWMQEIEVNNYPLLRPFLEGMTEQAVLTVSAQQTKRLYERGLTLPAIASERSLKTSTIEDHFVEIAMNDPSFDFRPFVTEALFGKIAETSASLQSKRLRDIKQHVPEADYFQIRLTLAAKGDAL